MPSRQQMTEALEALGSCHRYYSMGGWGEEAPFLRPTNLSGVTSGQTTNLCWKSPFTVQKLLGTEERAWVYRNIDLVWIPDLLSNCDILKLSLNSTLDCLEDPSRGYVILEESAPFLGFFFDNSLGRRKRIIIKMTLVHGNASKFCIIKMQVIIPLYTVTHLYPLSNSL